jgi:hypothetical protein
MGSLANTLFTIMLGWVQAAASSIWSAFTTENGGSFFRWIGRNWIILAAILCAIGLIVDLGIYLFRWRPLQVWKSYFNRLRHKEEVPEESEQSEQTAESTPVIPRRIFRYEGENETIPELMTILPQTGQEDFSRWETEKPEPASTAESVQKKPTITGAGYTVPADSPYRRPTEPIETDKHDGTEPKEGEADKPEIMTQKKRRRRLVVGELFNDPEEELWQYEKPQQLIDKDKAYHQPVYPRNWKTDEGENE